MERSAVYIHIPFCLRKCPYCDFYSTAGHDEKYRARFIEALCKEIDYYGRRYKSPRLIETVYIGGGTPTILKPEEIKKILQQLRKSFRVHSKAETTMECNPATATLNRMKGYREAGVNRISIGVQSFDNEVLRILGRPHTAEDARETFRLAAVAGFRFINLDLMFGIPGQTISSWTDTLRTVNSLYPQHVSLYSLEFMENTRFWQLREEGKMKETDAEYDRMMYEYALAILADRGYEQYEISNVSRGPKYRCKHNMKYWNLSEYLGFGPSAHSFVRNVRYSNIDDVEKYISAMERMDPAKDIFIGTTNAYGTEAVDCYIKNSFRDNVSEYVFTGLRKNDGLNLDDFSEKFGKGLWEVYDDQTHREFSEFVRDGFAEEDETGIRLTLKGMNISNRIMALFV